LRKEQREKVFKGNEEKAFPQDQEKEEKKPKMNRKVKGPPKIITV